MLKLNIILINRAAAKSVTIETNMHMQGGIIPPLATPLQDQDRLDEPGLERLIEHVVQGGVRALFVLGSTGEGPSLSQSLRANVIRAACRIAAGRVPVLVAVTDSAFTESCAMARVAADAGAAAVVVTPPFYFTYSQDQLANYVERLAVESPLPMFLYNIPHLTKVRFAAETIRQCADLPRVIGFKDSSFDLIYLAEVIRLTRFRPEFQVFCGPEELLLAAMTMGASGGVCGGSNYNPALFVSLYEAIKAGNYTEATRLQDLVQRIAKALYGIGDPGASYIRGMKATLACLGICGDLPALPLTPFSPTERALLETRVAEVQSWIATEAQVPAAVSR